MPLYLLTCLNGHQREEFCHTPADKGCRTHLCAQCGEGMGHIFSPGTSLTYFAEGGKGKWIENLGDQPVLVTSHAHHAQLMKERGVTWATPKRGMPGSWT